jgi:hypothetical protein
MQFGENYIIHENFLEELVFLSLQEKLMGSNFPYYMQKGVADYGDDDFYLCHRVYENGEPMSELHKICKNDIFSKLNIGVLLRSKVNLYPKTENVKEHDYHTDYPFKHKTALLSINTCDGYTILEDGTKVNSVANQLVLFDGSTPHASTSCSDQPCRVNIIFNYIDKSELDGKHP